MPRKLLVLLFLAVWVASLGALPAAAVQKDPGGQAREQATHLQRGRANFEKGFYEFLPKGRKSEAEQAFAAAIREFKLALADDPNSIDAHRGIARIYTVRGNHVEAAKHYRRLTELDPFDLDSYAQAAVALAELGRFAEARTELEKAKGRTVDPSSLAMLDGFLQKLTEAEKLAGAGR
jgi:tetratricopeptide (TPR) repeat protein